MSLTPLTSLHCRGRDPRLVGDPVDTLTGALFDGKLEFRLTGPLELWWWRHYDSSQCRRWSALGWGHTHDFDRRLYFDADGMRYEAPLGSVTGFGPLLQDGAEDTNQGFVLRRLSLYRYQLSRHEEPAMEFEFLRPGKRARLKRIFRGSDEIRFSYDDRHRLTGIVDSAARSLTVKEHDDGRLLSVALVRERTEPPVLLIAYEYDEHGNLVRTRNAAGVGYSFAYDAARRMVRRVGRKGFRFDFEYDAEGRCIRSSGAGRLYEASLEYQIPGRVTKVTRADGGVWTYLFDEAGGLLQIHDPTGAVRQFVRDEKGRLKVKIDPLGNTSRVIYDGAGAPIAEITPLGRRLPLPLDPNTPERLRPHVAANSLEYECGRMIEVDDIVLPSRADVRAIPIAESARRLLTVRPEAPDPAAAEQAHVLPLGRWWWPKPERGRGFDALGKLVAQTDPWGRQRSWQYDAAGNAAGHTDFDGGSWSYEYGQWHFLQSETNPLGGATHFSYTPEGDISSCTDAGGSRSEYRYDLRDRLSGVIRDGHVRETYVRDAAGNLIAKHAADGRLLMQIEVGPGNLPVKRVLSDDEHTFQYDAKGRHLLAATTRDAVTFSYTSSGQCREEKRNGAGIEHTYGEWRQPDESIVLGRFVTRYDRHAPRRVTVTDPGGQRHEVEALTLNGIVTRRLSNGTTEIAQYDRFGRCLMKSLRRRNATEWHRRYHWSGEGELRRVEDGEFGDIHHDYDAAHRLERRTYADGRVERFRIDRAGNLVEKPGLTDVVVAWGNRLASVNGKAVRYDDRNHIAERESQEGPSRYTYNGADQLIAIEKRNGTVVAEYDALGRRVRKIVQGQTTEFYWNGEQLIAEVESGGSCRLYLYADSWALTPFLMMEYASVDAPLDSGHRYFIFSDQLGTPCVIEDERGSPVWQARIAPYGEAEIAPGAEIEFNLRFPGHYFDPESGLHYNRHRYYDPALGRYIQSDPWGIAGGVNVYAYVSNPLLSSDVLGLGEGNKKPGEAEDGCEGTGSKPQGEDLDDKYGEVKPPTKVKPFERDDDGNVIKNPDLQEVKPGQPPNLDPNKQWLWLVDPQGRLLVGSEQPVGSPLDDGYQPKLGHPTLVGGGPGDPPARMGGELKQNPDGSWSVNNNSGRYSEHPDRGPEQLNNVNDRFKESGVDMGPTQDNPKRREPKT